MTRSFFANRFIASLLTAMLLGAGWTAAMADDEPADPPVPKGPSAVVTLADGSLVSVHDLVLEAGGMVVARSEVGPFRWAWDDILSVAMAETDARVSRFPALLLAGHQLMHGQVVTATEETIEIKSELFGEVAIPLSTLEGILLTERLVGSAKEKAVGRLRRLPRTGDAFLLANGDVLQGAISQFGPEQWTIDSQGEPRTVETNRLQGIALDPQLVDYQPKEGLQLVVRFVDGSLLAGTDLVVAEGKCEMKTSLGPKVTFSWVGDSGSAATRVEVRGGRARYLSELKPQSEQTESFFDAPVDWRVDANAEGQPIRLAGQTYDRGIGMRSKIQLDYDVTGYDRFCSLIGIDDSASDEASVVYRVLVDGKQIFESPPMALGIAPIPLDLSIEGGKVLSLVVDFAARGDAGDLADWAGARLVKSKR
jgi:hypothetical protein